MNKININRKFVLLAFVSVFLLSATLGNSFMTEAPCQKTTSSDSTDPFPQAGKFYTLAGRSFSWETVGGKNVTTGHSEEILKWSIQDVVGDVALVNRTYVVAYIRPQTGENYTDTYDFDYEIAINRTILSAYLKEMSFDTTGFLWSSERPLGEDVGEHTWGWFPTDLHIGAHVLVSWTFDNNFLGDMLYEVVGEEVIEVVGQKQDCWMLRMPPSVTVDGTQGRMETYWVDKDTGVPLKLYQEGWALDGSSGFDCEYVLVHTNIDLGPESTQPASPTYTLTVPTSPGFPEAGKFYTWYYLEEGWYISGATNVTYYNEGLYTFWVVNVTGGEALVHSILWSERICAAEGVKELEAASIRYINYTINVNTREILGISGLVYGVNMTSLTYEMEDHTTLLAGDVGEETYCWLPKNLNVGATVNITWTHDWPDSVDNGTYTVTGEKIINVLDKPQACWILYMSPTLSINGKWNISETIYSDKDVGIPLGFVGKEWAIDGSSAYSYLFEFVDTNVDLGPQTYIFPVVVDSQTFQIVVVTNSTIPVQTFNFSKENKELSFNVTGSSGTSGFCNVTIPRTMLDCASLDEWVIFANGTDIRNACLKSRDADYTYIFIPYTHSAQLIQVKCTWVVREFPSVIIVLLFTISTLLAAIVYRRKRYINNKLT